MSENSPIKVDRPIPSIAYHTAFDLAVCCVKQAECDNPHLADFRKEEIDRTFEKLALHLGYEVRRTNALYPK